MSNPSSSGAPVGLPPGTRPSGPAGNGANAGYSLPPAAAGPDAVAAGHPYASAPPQGTTSTPGTAQATATPKAQRSYKDLPKDPPYGPILPYRDPPPRRRRTAEPEIPGESSRITPWQIALGVGGILLLLALGIGGALLLLGNDDPGRDELADSPLPLESDEEGDPFGQLTPVPPPPAVADPPAPAPQPDPSAEPDDQPSAPPDDQGAAPPAGGPGTTPDDSGENPEGAAPAPDGDTAPPAAEPGDDPQPPGAAPSPLDPAPPGTGGTTPTDPDDGEVEFPVLFELSQLPRETTETGTRVTHTSSEEGEPSLEQVTRLDHPDGEITVRAVRSADAMDRFEALQRDDSREVTVRGRPAFVLEGQRLIWLVTGDPDTFLDIDGPATLGTDELLTIANGLELT